MAIQAFNQQLVLSCESRYDILDYVKKINELSNNPIEDLSFMEELMGYIQYNKCVVPHMLLVKYGVISGENSNNISHNVLKMLERYNFKLGIDFKRLHLEALESNGKTYHKKEYMLHPKTFKLCLVRCKNTEEYARYYLLLEDSIKYYHEYQLMYKDHIIKMKDSKIDEQSRKIDEQSRKIDELLAKQDKIIETNIELIEEVRNLQRYVAEIKEYLKQRAIPPDDSGKSNLVAILKNGTNEYYVIRRQKTSFNSAIKNKEKEGFTKVKDFSQVPNAVYLCANIIEWLKKKKIIKASRNTFTLVSNNINNDELMELMEEVFDERLLC